MPGDGIPIDGVVVFPSHHEIMVSNEMWPAVTRALRARDIMLSQVPDLPGDRPVHLVEPAYHPGELTDPDAPGGCHEALAAVTVLVLRTIDRELAEHEWIRNDPRWQARINRVADELAALYAELGEDILHSDSDPDGPSPAPPLRMLRNGEGTADGQPAD